MKEKDKNIYKEISTWALIAWMVGMCMCFGDSCAQLIWPKPPGQFEVTKTFVVRQGLPVEEEEVIVSNEVEEITTDETTMGFITPDDVIN